MSSVRLTRAQAEDARARVAAGETQTAVAHDLGVSQAAMSKIILNKTHVKVFMTPEELRERARRVRFRSTYGIPYERWEEMLEEAGHSCEACGTHLNAQPGHRDTGVPFLVHDHDHHTGVSRGVLCNSCNLALGQAGDSIERLQALIDYLRKKTGS